MSVEIENEKDEENARKGERAALESAEALVNTRANGPRHRSEQMGDRERRRSCGAREKEQRREARRRAGGSCSVAYVCWRAIAERVPYKRDEFLAGKIHPQDLVLYVLNVKECVR